MKDNSDEIRPARLERVTVQAVFLCDEDQMAGKSILSKVTAIAEDQGIMVLQAFTRTVNRNNIEVDLD